MFEKEFKVVEINSETGITITHFLKGKTRDIKKDINRFKKNSQRYEMFGKEGMVVWS